VTVKSHNYSQRGFLILKIKASYDIKTSSLKTSLSDKLKTVFKQNDIKKETQKKTLSLLPSQKKNSRKKLLFLQKQEKLNKLVYRNK
jgi:hypothetical protein